MSCFSPNFIVKRKVESAALRLQYRFEDKKESRGRNGWKMIKGSNQEFRFMTGYDYDNI